MSFLLEELSSCPHPSTNVEVRTAGPIHPISQTLTWALHCKKPESGRRWYHPDLRYSGVLNSLRAHGSVPRVRFSGLSLCLITRTSGHSAPNE